MTTSITWTSPSQWGASSGGVWVDLAPDDVAGDATLQTGFIDGGAIFDASSFQSLPIQAGRVLEAPIVTSFVLSLFATKIPASTGPWTIELGLVTGGQTSDFSSSLRPWTRGETSLGSFDLGTVPNLPTALQVSLTLPATTIRALCTSKGIWDGKLGLSIRQTTGTTVRLKNGPSFAFSMLTTQEIFFSGLAGGPYGGPVRVLRDGRYAMPAFTGGLVQDGDQPNLWVRPFDADPDDPEQEYRPRPGEGTVNDDVPNP